MTYSLKIRRFTALLWAAMFLLPSCTGGFKDSVCVSSEEDRQTSSSSGEKTVSDKMHPDETKTDTSSSAEDTSPSDSQGSGENESFRTLTNEEAEALFGHTEVHAMPTIGRQYVYYVGALDPHGSGSRTLYRCSCETGELEFACREQNCAHTKESDCPFAGTDTASDILVLEDDSVMFPAPDGKIIEWYDPGTGDRGSFDPDLGPGMWSRGCKVGNSIYFVREEDGDSEILPGRRLEIWRLDPKKGEIEKIYEAGQNDRPAFIMPCLLNGKETLIRTSSDLSDKKGTTSPQQPYIYATDVESGESTLLYDRGSAVSCINTCGRYFFFIKSNGFQSGGGEPVKYLHLVDTVTGIDRIIDKNILPMQPIMTDRCIMYFKNDSDGKGAYILSCYNYHTGVQTKYPLRGEGWEPENSTVLYYCGQIYLLSPRQYDSDGKTVKSSDLVIWDIVSGKQRAIQANVCVDEF